MSRLFSFLLLFTSINALADVPSVYLHLAEEDLWDAKTGIYKNATQKGKDWERPGKLLVKSESGQTTYETAVAVRMHGGASRSRSPKKSFRIYFRKEVGDNENKATLLTSSGQKQLVLRAGFNDTWTHDSSTQTKTATYVREQVARSIFKAMGYWVPQGTWVKLYLNDKYWGFYNLTESIHEKTLAIYFGSDDWDIVEDEQIQAGDEKAYSELKQLVANSDFSQDEVVAEVEKQVDIDNFTAYMITNIWLQNYDWPQKNWTIFRNRNGGKWQFTMWDVEYSLGGGSQGFRTDHNTLEHATGGKHFLGNLFAALLKNDKYKKYFWKKLEIYLKNQLSSQFVAKAVVDQAQLIAPLVPLEIERWAKDKSFAKLQKSWEKALQFTRERTPAVIKDFRYKIGDPPADFDRALLKGTEPGFFDGLDTLKDLVKYVF